MKHRSRVEREETEEADKKKLNGQNSLDLQRVAELELRLAKIEKKKKEISRHARAKWEQFPLEF
jgi:hypothetical protein